MEPNVVTPKVTEPARTRVSVPTEAAVSPPEFAGSGVRPRRPGALPERIIPSETGMSWSEVARVRESSQDQAQESERPRYSQVRVPLVATPLKKEARKQAIAVPPVAAPERGPLPESSRVRHRRPGPLPDKLTEAGVGAVSMQGKAPMHAAPVAPQAQSPLVSGGVRLTAPALRSPGASVPSPIAGQPNRDAEAQVLETRTASGKTISLSLSGRLAPAERQWLREMVQEVVREEGDRLLERHMGILSVTHQEEHARLLNQMTESVRQGMLGMAQGNIPTPELLRSFAEALKQEITLLLRQQGSESRGEYVGHSLIEETEWPGMPGDRPPVAPERVVRTRALFERFMSRTEGITVPMAGETSGNGVEERMYVDGLPTQAGDRVPHHTRSEMETIVVEEMLPGVGHLMADMADNVRRGLGQVGRNRVGKKIP
ncbi:MAG: hypothetical protein HQL78_11985 [Magnetococcales bacterium]|nr:hypothetical protein [Magnetococcales bacterium]